MKAMNMTETQDAIIERAGVKHRDKEEHVQYGVQYKFITGDKVYSDKYDCFAIFYNHSVGSDTCKYIIPTKCARDTTRKELRRRWIKFVLDLFPQVTMKRNSVIIPMTMDFMKVNFITHMLRYTHEGQQAMEYITELMDAGLCAPAAILCGQDMNVMTGHGFCHMYDNRYSLHTLWAISQIMYNDRLDSYPANAVIGNFGAPKFKKSIGYYSYAPSIKNSRAVDHYISCDGMYKSFPSVDVMFMPEFAEALKLDAESCLKMWKTLEEKK